MKKKLAIVGAVALAAVLGITASGCSNNTRNLASLASNWYQNPDFDKVQPTFIGEENAERLTYRVTQTEKSTNSDYSVEYTDGTYTTEFYAKAMTSDDLADITRDEWYADYVKENSIGKNNKVMYLYYYRTELTIPAVTYKYGNKTETFVEQKVVTESYFFSVEYYLRPVYSFREVKCAIPADLKASSLKECYTQVDMTYKTYYNVSGNRVYSQISGTSTTNGKEKDETSTLSVSGLNSNDNSVFDSAYIDIAVRAMKNITRSFSQAVSIYTPGLQPRDYTIASGTSALLSDKEKSAAQLAEIQAVLEEKGLFTPKPVDENDPDKGMTTLKTVSATVSYNAERYSGVSQKYWFAVGDSNETRTLMVKYSEPLAYNLGKLEYVLTGIGDEKSSSQDDANDNATKYSSSVTYYTNGGAFSDSGICYKRIFFKPGKPIFNIGVDKSELSIIRKNMTLAGWVKAEIDENGLPILIEMTENGEITGTVLQMKDDGSALMLDKDGRELSDEEKHFTAKLPDNPDEWEFVFDKGHPKIEENAHLYLVAVWIPNAN